MHWLTVSSSFQFIESPLNKLATTRKRNWILEKEEVKNEIFNTDDRSVGQRKI